MLRCSNITDVVTAVNEDGVHHCVVELDDGVNGVDLFIGIILILRHGHAALLRGIEIFVEAVIAATFLSCDSCGPRPYACRLLWNNLRRSIAGAVRLF